MKMSSTMSLLLFVLQFSVYILIDVIILLITIVSIDTDEGVLEPLGVGEVQIEVRY